MCQYSLQIGTTRIFKRTLLKYFVNFFKIHTFFSSNYHFQLGICIGFIGYINNSAKLSFEEYIRSSEFRKNHCLVKFACQSHYSSIFLKTEYKLNVIVDSDG